MSDGLLLLCGAVFLYLPGLVVLVLLRVKRPRIAIGVAPVVTLALLQLIALLRWGLGTGLAKTTVGVLGVLGVLALVLELRAGREGVVRTAVRSLRRAARQSPMGLALSTVLLLGAVAIGMSQWLRGMHGLATPPQEHDTVTHTLVAAWIAYTGRAGPFEIMPTDLVTGGHVYYYPAGAHMLAGMLAMLSGNVVSAFNAAVVLILGLAAPVTLFAAAAGFERLRTRPVFSGLAAVLAVTLYRPYFQYAHDAGILTYAMGLALAPAFAVAVTGLDGRVRRGMGYVVATGLVALGLYAVHPSLAVAVVTVLAIVAVTGALSSAGFRHWLRTRLAQLGVTTVVAAVLCAPWLMASLSVAGGVAAYPESPPALPLGQALKIVVGFNYGGFIFSSAAFQVGFAVLFWIGFAGCLTRRYLWPLAAAWFCWAAIAVLYTSGHAGLPGVAQLGAVFYNSWTRLDGIEWVIAPVVAALGISGLLTRVLEFRRPATWRLRAMLAPAFAALLAVVYFAVAGWQYMNVNAISVADRWGKPSFYRIAPTERQAFDYLAAHRSTVGRVLNNGNDGSTFAYVYDAIPVINIYPEGTMYGIYLMQHFNEIGTNSAVRCLVQRYHITHVIMSASSPPLLARGFPDHWVKTPWFTYPVGFSHLDKVPQVSLVFSNSGTLVFRIDPAVVNGHDGTGCTADPAHPVPTPTSTADDPASG